MLPLTIQSPMLLLSNRVVAMDILDVQSAACQWTRSVREAEMVHVCHRSVTAGGAQLR